MGKGKSGQSVKIPQGNIDTYLHWYKVLKDIQQMDFWEFDFDEPQKILKELQRRYDLSEDWFHATYKPINTKQCERADLFNPFRPVWHHMQRGMVTHKTPYKDLYPNTPGIGRGYYKTRDYGKKREGKDTKTNWAFNILLYGIVEDCHWYGDGAKFAEAENILGKLEIKEAENMTYENVSKHYKGIDRADIGELLKKLYEACKTTFIPASVVISEWPPDFLANIAHSTGYKINPYIARKAHFTTEMIQNLKPHLQKLLTNRK